MPSIAQSSPADHQLLRSISPAGVTPASHITPKSQHLIDARLVLGVYSGDHFDGLALTRQGQELRSHD